jgi:Skp family chaperone for outer membrane proteins
MEKRGKVESRKLEDELNAVVEEMEAVKQELQLLYARTEEESLEKS